jgi:sulfoxide reductase heme-binding subunit YedZ
MNIDWLDISATMGLCAMLFLTFNLLLGIIISTPYRRSALWNRLPYFIKGTSLIWLHNWTAYTALSVALIHPLLLLAAKATKFGITDILLPFHAPKQQLWVSAGVLSLYALILVIITTQKAVKRKMGFRAWKNIHLISYGTALLFLIHGLVMDPELKDRSPDWFDGEKVLCEVCILVLLLATIARYAYFLKNRRQKNST